MKKLIKKSFNDIGDIELCNLRFVLYYYFITILTLFLAASQKIVVARYLVKCRVKIITDAAHSFFKSCQEMFLVIRIDKFVLH